MTDCMKIILAVALLATLSFGFLGTRGIWQPDEGYYVATAVTMQQKGDILIPRMGESIFLEKPPIMYWGILAGIQWLGHSEFAARAFHGLCFLATGLVVMILAHSLFPGRGAGLWAGILYATMPVPYIAASFITPDTPLALMTTLAMLCFWQSVRPQARRTGLWKILMSAALGLGFLCKGPAALIPTAGMFVYLLVHGRVRDYFFRSVSWACLAMFLAVGLWWFVWVSIQVPGAARYFFDNQIWGRLVSDKYERNPGFAGALIYLPTILLGCLPWSIGWFTQRKLWMGEKLSRDLWRRFRADPAGSLLICWIAIPLLILVLASSKLPFYVLPLFPALAIGSAILWIRENTVEGKIRPDRVRRTMLTVALWCGLMLVCRWAAVLYPTPNDMRSLWTEVSPHLPAEPYEIVTLDEPADGMIFYGAKEVENITARANPYPVFDMPETLVYELDEIKASPNPYLILAQNPGKLTLIRNALNHEGVGFRAVPLRFKRTLLICDPPKVPDSKNSQE
jgi:4-amino-4-deoxy-L-arabinose transferase-like glycosyltransferase